MLCTRALHSSRRRQRHEAPSGDGVTPAQLAVTLPGGSPGGATGELPGGGTDTARARKRADTNGRRVLKILLCTSGYDAAAVNEKNEPAIEVAARRSGNDDLFRLVNACLVPQHPPQGRHAMRCRLDRVAH